MKHTLLVIFLLMLRAVASGQEQPTFATDTIFMLPEARVNSQFLNDTDRYRYNQMKHYVTTILPYMNAATKLFKELDNELKTGDRNRKSKRKYVKAKEEEIRTEFEDRVKDLNVTQGKLLVKLIARQTELNIYQILKEFKNPLTAIKWQAWGKVNGMNLDRRYHPEEEITLESIMYELGYPLPSGYAQYYSGEG